MASAIMPQGNPFRRRAFPPRHRGKGVLTQSRKAAKRQRKLASYAVAGFGLEIYFRRGATVEDCLFSIVLSGRISFLRGNPATMWLANFRLSLWDEKFILTARSSVVTLR
ncbi:MAG TPA: hypothetical protein VGH42_09005 [Verrucomicrobiae bacterium]